MTEQEMRELFREMRDEPVPADSLARVRMGVDHRTRRWVTPWKVVAVLAMTGCIVAGFLFLRPARTPVKTAEPVPVEIAQVQPTPAPSEPPVRTVSRPRRTRRRSVESMPVLIRIETPDPDVVILLVN